jgi:hypothetical protein
VIATMSTGLSFKISDAELTADLAAAGLAFGRWLTEDQRCFSQKDEGRVIDRTR